MKYLILTSFLIFFNLLHSQITSFPFFEDFDSTSCSLPSGFGNSGSDPWDFQNVSETYMQGGDHTTGTGCFASMDDSGPTQDDSCILTTPIFNLTSVPNAELRFWWQNCSTSSTPDLAGPRKWSGLNVDISIDSGATWNRDVWLVVDSQQIGWVEGVISLDSFISNNTIIRFRGLETQSFKSDLSLDDISISEPSKNDAGITEILGLNAVCPGAITLFARLKNFGIDTLKTDSIHWSINGINQNSILFTGSLSKYSDTVLSIGSTTLSSSMVYEIKVWSTSPNGSIDGNIFNDTLVKSNIKTALNGTYSIGSSGDYLDMVLAVSDINSRGVCGPVIFNVSNSVYNGKLKIGPIVGASSTNTIVFNGNGSTISDSTDVNDRILLGFDSANYVTIDSFIIKSLSGQYVYGVHFINASNYNTIINCEIDLTTVTDNTLDHSAGILASNSKTSTYPGYNSANYCTFENNKIIGGSSGLYFGIRLNGRNGGQFCVGNKILNNTIQNVYASNIYLDDTDGTIVSGNDISRKNKVMAGTFYGIYLATGNRGVLVEKNFIHNTHDAAINKSTGCYSLMSLDCDAPSSAPNIFENNLIYNLNGDGIVVGIYNYDSDNTNYYYNTISLDHSSSSGGITRGFDQENAAAGIIFKNNIISITRGGGGLRHGLHFQSTGSTIASDNNVIYVPGSNATNKTGKWGSTTSNTLSQWKLVNSGVFDQNSDGHDPQFVGINQNDYTPNSFYANNGAVVLSGISDDIFGNSRDPMYPDIGAIEFTPLPLNDSCATAQLITAGSYPGSTIRSTNDTVSSCTVQVDSAGGVWYKYISKGDFVQASLCGSSINTKLSIYEGNCDSLVCITDNDDSCGVNAIVGWCSKDSTEYYIFVHGTDTTKGDFVLSLTEITVDKPTISFSPDTVICEGDSVELESSLADVYIWNDNNSGSQKILIGDERFYSVTTTDSNGCSSTSDSIRIRLLELPVVDLGNDTTICKNCHIIFDGGIWSSYKWHTGSPFRFYTFYGTFGGDTVHVEVTDDQGCVGYDSVIVDVPTRIHENLNTKNSLHVFPNPNNGVFRLVNLPPTSLTILINSIDGNVIYTKELTNSVNDEHIIDLQDSEKGIYILSIRSSDFFEFIKLSID